MYVRFEFTREDLVDASKRFINQRNRERSRVWRSSIYSAISVGVITFFLFRNNLTIALFAGLVAAGIILLLYAKLENSGIEGRLRRAVAEVMPDPKPYVCEVEIKAEGVWLRQMNKQTIFEWLSIEVVEETSGSVDIFTRDGGGVIVRSRAFGSEGERKRFVELVRSRLIESRG